MFQMDEVSLKFTAFCVPRALTTYKIPYEKSYATKSTLGKFDTRKRIILLKESGHLQNRWNGLTGNINPSFQTNYLKNVNEFVLNDILIINHHRTLHHISFGVSYIANIAVQTRIPKQVSLHGARCMVNGMTAISITDVARAIQVMNVRKLARGKM